MTTLIQSHNYTINLDNVVELKDETDLQAELACYAGQCEIV